MEARVVDRRAWLSSTSSLLGAVGLATPVQAVSEAFSTYEDTIHNFSIDIPSSWTSTTQSLQDRRTIKLWFDPADPKATLLFIAFTPIRDDFTSLGSFGSVDQVAAQTILPKGNIAGVDVQSEMLSAVSKNQAYYFDYVQQVPDVAPQTHFRTIFTLQQGATGGAGAVLVTITAQTPEERYSQGGMKALFDTIINSYKRI